MNVRFLIDRLVQQQASLLAELATSGGVRAPLAELSDQMFIHLAEELDRRGVSRKVSADMFGLVLRAYLKKIQRLSASSTETGSSLWQAVVDYLNASGPRSKAQLLQRFCRDDEVLLRAVLHDLSESGLVIVDKAGLYSLTETESSRWTDGETFADLLWLTIFREGPITKEKLLERHQRRLEQCESALLQLVETGRVTAFTTEAGPSFESTRFEIAHGQASGWEAAILDHFQAMVRTIVGVLPGLVGTATTGPAVGGFTYSLDVWPGHPLAEEVEGTLAELRSRFSSLRRRVDEYNAEVSLPPEYSEVRIYGGQSVTARRTNNLSAGRTSSPSSSPPPGDESE